MQIDYFPGCCTSRIINTFPCNNLWEQDKTGYARQLRTLLETAANEGTLSLHAALGPRQSMARKALEKEGFVCVGWYPGHAGKISIMAKGLIASAIKVVKRKRR